MREKLIDLLYEAEGLVNNELPTIEMVADHLIANGVTVPDKNVGKWIPVSERLPERNTEVLVCDTREDYVSIWGYIGDELWFGEEITWATEDITHWMPLPEPPKEE
jgi:hypothetical protein